MAFYIYVWKDQAGTPFYVGKGSKSRAWNTYAKHRSDAFLEIFLRGGCTVEIVAEFEDEQQAFAHEIELISRHGRRDAGTGVLVNQTRGGDGPSGRIPSEKHKRRASETQRRRFQDPTERAKQSTGNVRRYQDPDEREKTRQSQLRRFDDPKELDRLREWTAKSRTPESRALAVAKIRLAPPSSNNTSGFKGVSFHKRDMKWTAQIHAAGRLRTIGRFASAEAAARAYDAAAVAAWGLGNCYLNFPEEAALGLAG